MNICVKTGVLKNAATIAYKAVTIGNSILDNLLLEFDEKTVFVTGSDGSKTIRTRIPEADMEQVTIKEAGKFLINGKFLLELLKGLPEDQEIQIQNIEKTNVLDIQSGAMKYHVLTIKPEQYVAAPGVEEITRIPIGKDVLQDLSREVMICVAKNDPARIAMSGVHLYKGENGKLVAEATDAYCYAYAEKSLDIAGEFDAILPVPVFTAAGILGNDISIGTDGKKIQLADENTILSCTMISQKFPDTKKIRSMKGDAAIAFTCNRAELIGSIGRCALIQRQSVNVPLVELTASKEGLAVKSNCQEFGDYADLIGGEYSQDKELKLVVACDQLSAALKAVKGEDVSLRFTSPVKPLIIQGEDESLWHLMTPVRTH